MVASRIDLTLKTDAEIDNWIANHERLKKTDSDLYRDLITERNRRFGRGLKIEVSVRVLTDAAKARQFVSYGEIAEANGITWSKARHIMNGKHGHLDDILAYCNAHNLPLLTAIIVQKGKLETGDMNEFTLAGFVEGAKRIGRNFTNDMEFLRQCQEDCFIWGATAI